MAKNPLKPTDTDSNPHALVPTHGGVYRVEGGALIAVEGGPPDAGAAAQTPAVDPGQTKAGDAS